MSVNQKVAAAKENIASPVEMTVDTDPMLQGIQAALDEAQTYAANVYKDIATNMSKEVKADTQGYASEYWKQQMKLYQDKLGDIERLKQQAVERQKEINAELNKKHESQINVKLTGEASPKLPLTETLKNVSGAMDNFAGKITDKKMNVGIDGMGKTGDIASMLNSLGSSGGAGLGSAQQAWAQKYGAEKSMELSNLVSQAIAPAINKMAFPDVKGGASVDVSKMFEGVKDLGKTELQIGSKAYPVTAQQDVIKIMQDELRRMKMTGAMR